MIFIKHFNFLLMFDKEEYQKDFPFQPSQYVDDWIC